MWSKFISLKLGGRDLYWGSIGQVISLPGNEPLPYQTCEPNLSGSRWRGGMQCRLLATQKVSTYLRQLFELVGIEEKFLQAAAVAEYLIRDCFQVAVPLVHRLDVAVAAPQGDTLQHVRPPCRVRSPVLLKPPHRWWRRSLGEYHSMSKHLLCVPTMIRNRRPKST